MTELDTIEHADLFDLCDQLDAASIDMILCDLPYGTTACSWDTVIPFAPMWAAFKRVIKPRGAIVLTASQPFTSALVMSNVGMFRYSWVWLKSRSANFTQANFRPLKTHEDILVFSVASATPGASLLMAYCPQGMNAKSVKRFRRIGMGIAMDRASQLGEYIGKGSNYPTSILAVDGEAETVHPTQKPVALFRYLIRTYTQSGDVVLDPCVGSGTTALAAREEQRHWICGDSSAEYVAVAQKRMDAPYTLPLFKEG
jgi:site-specific DNA-methyltransferase (adenine-specific)